MTRITALRGAVAVEAVIFVLGSFAANLLTGPIGTTWPMYIAIAIAIGIAYAIVRWTLLRPERAGLIFSQRLADSLARSAEPYGLVAIYNMQLRSDQDRRNFDTQLMIRGAHSMRLAANSGASYLSPGVNRHWNDVRGRLEGGVPFKVVLLDPIQGDTRALRNRLNVAGEAEDSKLPLGDIIRACNRYPHLEVRFARAGMTSTVFLGQEVAFFDPYHLATEGDRITNLFFCLQIENVRPPDGLSHYDLLSRHFDSLWLSAMPLRDWLVVHREHLEPLPALT